MLKQFAPEIVSSQSSSAARETMFFQDSNCLIPPKEFSDAIGSLREFSRSTQRRQLHLSGILGGLYQADTVRGLSQDLSNVLVSSYHRDEVELLLVMNKLLRQSVQRIAAAFDLIRVQGAVDDSYVDSCGMSRKPEFVDDQRRLAESSRKSGFQCFSDVGVTHVEVSCKTSLARIVGDFLERVDTLGHAILRSSQRLVQS